MLSEGQLFVFHVGSSAVVDLAFSLICGALAALLWKELPLPCARRLFLVCGVSGILIALMQPLHLAILTAVMTGATRFAELPPAFGDVLETHAGRILFPQGIMAILLAFAALLPLPRRYRLSVCGVFFLALSVFRAAAGHAASDGDYTLRELSQWVHLLSTAVWAGGVLVAGWIVFPRLVSAEEQYRCGRSLSFQSTMALGFLFLSGLWNTWLGVEGEAKALLHSRWGAILAVKVLLVVAALALGVMNRRTLAMPLTDDSASRFRLTVQTEAGLMLAILLLSAWLGNTSPLPG